MTRVANDPSELLSVEELKAISGLAFLRGIVDGHYPAPPISRTLNFQLIAVEAGRAVFEGAPGIESYNPIGSVHGGWYGAVLDSCMSCAVQTTLEAGFGYTTLEYRVNMVRPLLVGSERVQAIGEALHVGARTGAAEGKIVGVDSGKLYGFGTATCLIMAL